MSLRQKGVAFFCAVVMLSPFFAQEEDASAAEPEENAVEQVVVSKQEKEDAKKAAQEKKKAAKADAKRRKNERTDPYLGVVYLPVRNYDVKTGMVQVALRGGTGSFNVFARKGAHGLGTAVLSDVDDSSSSYFSVLIDGAEYRLGQDVGAPEVRQLESSGQLAYTLAKKLQAVIDFSPFSSVTGGEADMVRLTVYMTSLSQKPQTVALKALFDTILGENTDYHFYTGDEMKINASRQFFDMDTLRWITSTNGKTAVQFLLSGKTISSPEAVTLANRDELYRARWIPVVKEHNGFNGVLAYNNSALMLSWPAFVLEPEKTETVTLYMALAIDGNEPAGERFLENVTQTETYSDDTPKVENNGFVVRKPDVEFVVPPVTDSQLDPLYIQQLIDRIDNLQSDPALVDRTEVRQLNAELDAILEKIRQQR